jgi:hypothetical protein
MFLKQINTTILLISPLKKKSSCVTDKQEIDVTQHQ